MYRVTWVEAALDELANLYVAAGGPVERAIMAAGVESLNRRLADDPFDVGESRDAGTRVGFTPKLMVQFRVLSDRGEVRVVAVTRYGR